MNDGSLPLSAAAPEAPPSPPPVVLCVDDEANILSALRRLFRPAGYRVLVAGGGAEGLQMLEAEHGAVDVIISDMRMPEMDGARFLSQVRQRWPDCARILLTGYADIESTVAAINEGEIYRYISKPWNDSEVLLTVRDVLERKHLEREKTRLEALTRAQNEELRSLNASLEEKVQARTEQLRVANEQLKKSFLTSIRVFANLIEMREGGIAGHSRRVADLARRIAVQMGLDGHETQDVFVAGLLHDIGKIGMPDELLGKPAQFMTGESLALWRKHPAKGEQALMALEDLRGAARLIRCHHERFDGKGYPDRLAGEHIPIGARILMFANEYDGLRSGSLTGRKHDERDAEEYVLQRKGSAYDPAVVDAFIALSGSRPEPVVSELAMAPANLRPGMVLARDLISRDGVLLLAADYILDEGLIRQIREFEHAEGGGVVVHVRPPETHQRAERRS